MQEIVIVHDRYASTQKNFVIFKGFYEEDLVNMIGDNERLGLTEFTHGPSWPNKNFRCQFDDTISLETMKYRIKSWLKQKSIHNVEVVTIVGSCRENPGLEPGNYHTFEQPKTTEPTKITKPKV